MDEAVDETVDETVDEAVDETPARPGRGRPLDASRLKALAHPLRLALLELLLDGGPATASGLGRLVGESSGTTSYHLRRLADVGLIEEAADIGTGRDRHWRAVSGWSLDTELLEQPTTRDDARMVVDEIERRNAERVRRWLRESTQWPTSWREDAILGTARLQLSHEQMRDLGAELLEVVDRYRQQQADPGTPRTTRVAALTYVFPTGDVPADVPQGP